MIKPLTSLRFVFALMVFLSHLQFYRGEEILFHQLYSDYFSEGYLGVSFFFILSGFILSYTYKTKIENGTTGNHEFWLARFARIYPLHLFSFLLSLPLIFVAANLPDISLFAANLLLLQAFIPLQDYFFSFNSPSWSISCEMFFYFLFPFLVKAARQTVFFRFIAIGLLVLVLVGIWLSPQELVRPLFYIHPFSRLADFILGIVLYQFFEKGFGRNYFKNYIRASVIEVLVVAVFLLFFLLHNQVPKGFRYSAYYWLPMMLIIYTFSFSKGILSGLLSSRVFVLLGEISFSMYLLHKLIISYILELNAYLQITNSSFILSSIMFLLTIAASYLVFKTIEMPMNKWIKIKLRPLVVNRFVKYNS